MVLTHHKYIDACLINFTFTIVVRFIGDARASLFIQFDLIKNIDLFIFFFFFFLHVRQITFFFLQFFSHKILFSFCATSEFSPLFCCLFVFSLLILLFCLIDLYLGATLPQIFYSPTSLEFARDYVGKNLPVVIRGAITDWPACSKWSSKYFRSTIGDKLVQVAVTPNGFADGIAIKKPENQEYFVMPEEQTMTMEQFVGRLDCKDKHICYIQKQNSNLERDFPELHDDIDMNSLRFACEAFNKDPDAINFWMGDERAITSSMFFCDEISIFIQFFQLFLFPI